MEPSHCIQRILIVLSLASFGAYYAYDVLAPKGDKLSEDYKYADLYPIPLDRAKNFSSPIAVSLDMDKMHMALFIYQGLIAFYMLLCFFRRDSRCILSPWFYMLWSVACLGEMSYITTLLRQFFLSSVLLLSLTTIMRHGAFGFACYGLKQYLEQSTKTRKLDVWGLRLLVLNGLLFTQAWGTVLLTLHVAALLTKNFAISVEVARYACMAILVVVTVAWFLIQNFVIERYARFTFAGLIFMVIFAVSWVLEVRKHFVERSIYFRLCVGFLALTAALLVLRVILVFTKERGQTRSKPTTESTEKIEM